VASLLSTHPISTPSISAITIRKQPKVLLAGKAKQANSQNQQQDDEYVKEAFDSHGQIVLSK